MSRRLSRRTLLRAAGGIAFALPFLESQQAFAQGAPPKRFVALYFPNGPFTNRWVPAPGATEADFTLAPSHAALESLRQHLLLVRGLNLDVARSGVGEQHQRGLGGMLTGRKLSDGNFIGNDGSRAGWATGPSLDQSLVPLIGQGTLVPSLQLGVNVRERDVSGVMSYAGAASPLLPQNDPRVVFRTLFMDVGGGGGADGGVLEGLQLKRASILDTVLDQFNALSKKVPAAERLRLDEHATRVRELERRVTMLPDAGPVGCVTPGEPPLIDHGTEAAMPDAARLHLDLLAVALSCDITRVATVMFSDAKNHIAMPFVNVPAGVHNISHYGDSDPNRLLLANRDTWVVEQFARLATSLATTPEAGGSVLDNTVLYLGSELSKGNLHSHDDLTVVMAGGGAGFRTGRLVMAAGNSHNDLLSSLHSGLTGLSGQYGDPAFGAGPLPGLT